MKITGIIFFFVIFVLNGIATYVPDVCGKQPHKEVYNLKPTADTVKYIIKEYSKRHKNCSPDSQNCTQIKINYIHLTEGKSKDIINSHIQNQLSKLYGFEDKSYKNMESMAEAFLNDYENFSKETEVIDIPWYLFCDVGIFFNSQYILCVAESYESFTGGAHGIYLTTYYNFDLNAGKLLLLTDIFKKGFEKKLNKIIDRKFREKNKLKPKDDLRDAGLFENLITFSYNFALDREGIDFHYNIYEIAPYVYGASDIKIKWDELRDIIPKNGLINSIINK